MLQAQIAQKATFSSTPQIDFRVSLKLTLVSTVAMLPWRKKRT